MATQDWFRNKDWNTKIEEGFFNKLKRARYKGQYLRIQACNLVDSFPEIALKLLEHYFALDEFSDVSIACEYSIACEHKAEAYIRLGNVPKAIEAYEEALTREDVFPGAILSSASLEFPFFIATKKLESLYDRALDILDKYPLQPMAFPIQFFTWHASKALILSELNHKDTARLHAIEALREAEKEESEFKHHSHLVLVGAKYGPFKELLTLIAR